MELCVGLDVGLEETSICVIDREGRVVRETMVSTEPAAIRCALEGYADRLQRVGVEASSLGMWLHRELHPAGLPIVVVEARHMRVSLSTMETDRNDARGIAQMMRLGWFRAVHVKNVEAQKMRTLLSNRKLLKRKLVDIENHIRGALRTYGLLVGPISRGRYEARIRELIEHTDIRVQNHDRDDAGGAPGHLRGLRQAAQDRPAGCSARCSLPASDDGSGRRTGCRVVIQGGRG